MPKSAHQISDHKKRYIQAFCLLIEVHNMAWEALLPKHNIITNISLSKPQMWEIEEHIYNKEM